MKKFSTYRKLVNLLKKKCQLAFPVAIRRVKLDSDGECILHKKKFLIRINKDLSEALAMETLIHEIAHARAWNHMHDKCDSEELDKVAHDAAWGVAYAEVYRIYEQILTENELD